MSVRHVPASHPVVRRAAVIDQLRDAMREARPLPGVSPLQIERYTLCLDEIARLTWDLPDWSPTIQQAGLLKVIADELMRRARS